MAAELALCYTIEMGSIVIITRVERIFMPENATFS
jgi:hypothetical protein